MEPRIAINLSSEPFRKDRPMMVASAVVCVLLVGLLAVLGTLIFAERSQVAGTREAIREAEAHLEKTRRENARVAAVLRRPANADVLDRSIFLNDLLRRKAISWTRMFADLEKVMPYSVRLISVRPAVTSDNRVYLDMIVGARSGEAIIEFLKKLEGSPLFGSTAVSISQPPAENEPLYRYRISVNYDQKL
jgi:type IV pilus assembly protein PilN